MVETQLTYLQGLSEMIGVPISDNQIDDLLMWYAKMTDLTPSDILGIDIDENKLKKIFDIGESEFSKGNVVSLDQIMNIQFVEDVNRIKRDLGALPSKYQTLVVKEFFPELGNSVFPSQTEIYAAAIEGALEQIVDRYIPGNNKIMKKAKTYLVDLGKDAVYEQLEKRISMIEAKVGKNSNSNSKKVSKEDDKGPLYVLGLSEMIGVPISDNQIDDLLMWYANVNEVSPSTILGKNVDENKLRNLFDIGQTEYDKGNNLSIDEVLAIQYTKDAKIISEDLKTLPAEYQAQILKDFIPKNGNTQVRSQTEIYATAIEDALKQMIDKYVPGNNKIMKKAKLYLVDLGKDAVYEQLEKRLGKN